MMYDSNQAQLFYDKHFKDNNDEDDDMPTPDKNNFPKKVQRTRKKSIKRQM